jgi:PAS domain-containing protein
MKTREPKLLTIVDGTLLQSLTEGFEWGGFGEPCREDIVCPIRPTTGENVMGFLVVGVNPRPPFDDDYQSFIRLLDRQLATSLASVTLLEVEVRRGLTAAETAALERSRLSEELAVQRSRLHRIAEISPVVMFSIDSEGVSLEANDRWFEMAGHPRNTVYAMSWMDKIMESSVAVMEKGWERLTVDGIPWSAGLVGQTLRQVIFKEQHTDCANLQQVKKPWYDSATGEEVDCWMLAHISPNF